MPEQPTQQLMPEDRVQAIANFKQAIENPPMKPDGTVWTPEELVESFIRQFGFNPYAAEEGMPPGGP